MVCSGKLMTTFSFVNYPSVIVIYHTSDFIEEVSFFEETENIIPIWQWSFPSTYIRKV